MVTGDILAAAVFLPDRSERKGLGLFHESEARGVVAVLLGLAQERGGLEERGEEALDGRTGADDPRGDAVDAGIEKI